MKQDKNQIQYLVDFQKFMNAPRVKSLNTPNLKASAFLAQNPFPEVVKEVSVKKKPVAKKKAAPKKITKAK